MRHLLSIAVNHLLGELQPLDQLTVGERKEPWSCMCDELGLGLLLGVVKAGEPMLGIVVLALGPYFGGALRLVLVGADEVQTAPGRARVANDEDHPLAARHRALDVQLSRLQMMRNGVPLVVFDRVDAQLGRVQDQRRGLRQRGQAQLNSAPDLALRLVDPDLDDQAIDPRVSIWGVVR